MDRDTIATGSFISFGPEPALAIPINAVLHASSGMLIYLIAQAIFPGKVGHNAGLLVSVLFIVFPSSLNWYAQVHKDGYAILGLLLVLYSWVKWTSIENCKSKLFLFLAGNLIGGILLLSVRSYAVDILFLAILLLFLISLSNNLINNRMLWKTIVGGISAILFIGLLVIAVHTYKLGTDINSFTSTEVFDRATKKCPTSESWEWQSDDIFPAKLDDYAKAATRIRLVFICSAYEADSNQDRHKAPENIIDIVGYLPRVLQIALFAPFPDTWFKEASITKIIGWAEIFAWYLLAPGIILLLWQRPIQQVWIVLGFVFVFVLVYGYVIPNLGTLHRIRYPFIMMLMLLGALGWCGILSEPLHSEIFKKRQSDSI